MSGGLCPPIALTWAASGLCRLLYRVYCTLHLPYTSVRGQEVNMTVTYTRYVH